ncbi:hypothetical protein [Streptomyces griseus]|uniref:hypothetical protein n=1 Tax=Streptomyces griseus TaxID=1911 RepID=UPI00131C57FF|nr:hypothetical protein [Streptomyces griseus]
MQADPDPADVVEGYFSAVNDGDYVAAWALGGKNIVGGRYDDFVESFADTANDKVTINSVVGETVEIELDAAQSDGSHRFFAGTYTVRDGVIIDADIHASKQPPSAKTPSLYVRTGYERGALYEPADFPKKIALDNHNYISDLQWKQPGASDIKATGTLNENKCEPSCAEDDYVTYPIEVRASEPRQCAVEVYKPYSDEKRMVGAYVYDRISVRTLNGNPDPSLVGDEVFSAPCNESR